MKLNLTQAYWFRRYLGWFPFQPCFICQKWYWGGFPWFGWQACYKEFCSTKCYKTNCEIEEQFLT